MICDSGRTTVCDTLFQDPIVGLARAVMTGMPVYGGARHLAETLGGCEMNFRCRVGRGEAVGLVRRPGIGVGPPAYLSDFFITGGRR